VEKSFYVNEFAKRHRKTLKRLRVLKAHITREIKAAEVYMAAAAAAAAEAAAATTHSE
jgi:septal ring factor EnvC (AmiA/AmiB activator)